jgi:hypothetical protein
MLTLVDEIPNLSTDMNVPPSFQKSNVRIRLTHELEFIMMDLFLSRVLIKFMDTYYPVKIVQKVSPLISARISGNSVCVVPMASFL